MKSYDVRCPYCGKLNRSVYLEETNGWMECIFFSTPSRTTEAGEKPDLAARIISPLHMAVSTCKGV